MLRLRNAREDDSALLFAWANDPIARRFSIHPDPIAWHTHLDWLQRVLSDPQRRLWIGEDANGQPVGQIRFDRMGERACVSVSLDAARRGQGLGVCLIAQGATALFAQADITSIDALIRPENTASQRAFERAGFISDGLHEVNGLRLLRFILQNTPDENARDFRQNSDAYALPFAHAMRNPMPADTLAPALTPVSPDVADVAPFLTINGRRIGAGYPVYIIAELSANHGQDFEQAQALVTAAHHCGADAVKLQTYTPDSMTLDCAGDCFQAGANGLWAGRSLYALYQEAQTPWEWHGPLKAQANALGMDLFSSPFDHHAVDFLARLDMPAYKIASFEIVDLPLIRKAARTGRPLIMSTGMATEEEIVDALDAARQAGAADIALLKCASAYPAPPDAMRLRMIQRLAERFQVPIGLSDHSMGLAVPVAAVALGACIVEKHFTLSRACPGPDSAFSLEPEEFWQMVEAVRMTEQALGRPDQAMSAEEAESLRYRRSLFVVEDVSAGETFTPRNVRVIRPGDGLAPKHLEAVLGRTARADIARGAPLRWEMVF